MPTVGSGLTLQPGYQAPAGNGLGDTVGSYGGRCVQILTSVACVVGDAVYLSSASHVSKGLTANIALGMGIVVGGRRTGGRTYPEAKIGDVAASAAEDWVLVCYDGKCRVVADAAITVGASLTFGGTTAGRVDDPVTDATTVIGTRLGRALTAAATPGDELDALITLM